MCPWVFLKLSLMITTSMLVRRSSMDVGDDGEMRWSNNDLQSVAMMGLRFWRASLAFPNSKGPSMASHKSKLSHSAVPVAVPMARHSADHGRASCSWQTIASPSHGIPTSFQTKLKVLMSEC